MGQGDSNDNIQVNIARMLQILLHTFFLEGDRRRPPVRPRSPAVQNRTRRGASFPPPGSPKTDRSLPGRARHQPDPPLAVSAARLVPLLLRSQLSRIASRYSRFLNKLH